MTNATDPETAQIQSNDEMPDRDELTELRRNQGLTNDEIAEDHFPQFTPRQIGLFASMYDIKKGWKDEAYLREQIEGGTTPAELADQWPVQESTVRSWMDEFDIDENPIPGAYNDAIAAVGKLASEIESYEDDGDAAKEINDIAEDLQIRYEDWRA